VSLLSNEIQGSDAQRLLLLVHGYGADERDLGGLLPYLDPDGHFATVLPRAPLQAPGTPGFAWYAFDGDLAAGFTSARDELEACFAEASERLGFARDASVVSGFSQGGGLALALGLRKGAPARPIAVLAMSPAVPDLALLDVDPDAARSVPVLIQHGTHDALIPVKQVRQVARALQAAGVPVVYREYPMEHQVAMESLRDAREWLAEVLSGSQPNEPVPDDPVERVPSVTTATFQRDVVDADAPVIVDFWAPWCQPCRQVAPIIEQMSVMRAGSYKFVKINIDEEPQLAQQFDVQSIPMIALFRNGRLERRVLGAKPRQQLEAELGMLVLP
jgi:thioredoxin 1